MQKTVFAVALTLKKNAKNALNTNKLLQKTQGYQLSEEGFSTTSESGQCFIKWDELYKTVESKEIIQLFISQQQAHILPKRCFNGDISQFELLRTYMKNAPATKEKKSILHLTKGSKIGCFAVFILLFLVVYFIYASAK